MSSRILLASVLVASASLASTSVVRAEPATEPSVRATTPGLENPFRSVYESPPRLLRLGVQMGGVHHDGVGPRIWVVPWEYLQGSVSYGYGTEHSFAGVAAFSLFPRAPLTPYVVSGYTLAVTTLPYGLKMWTHRVVAGIGLEARVLDRYYLGAEATVNTIWKVTLKNKQDTMDLEPGERYSFEPGFHLGMTL